MKKLSLIPHHTTQELYQRYRSCKNVQEARRWHILWLLSIDTPISAIVTATGMSRTWIWHVCTRYNSYGSEGVKRQQMRRSGANPILTPQQFHLLCQTLMLPPPDGKRWTSQKVAAWICATTGRKSVATRTGWVYLCRWRQSQGTGTSFTQQVVPNQADDVIKSQMQRKAHVSRR